MTALIVLLIITVIGLALYISYFIVVEYGIHRSMTEDYVRDHMYEVKAKRMNFSDFYKAFNTYLIDQEIDNNFPTSYFGEWDNERLTHRHKYHASQIVFDYTPYLLDPYSLWLTHRYINRIQRTTRRVDNSWIEE